LKEALFKNVPKELFDRPKAGFAIPIHEWMRSDLKDWASHLIFDLDFEDSEIINYEEIQKIWKQFLNGDNSYTYHIWDIIMLKAWMEKQKTI
jgi:asparagine synthase (glutamine-hydrolysing)